MSSRSRQILRASVGLGTLILSVSRSPIIRYYCSNGDRYEDKMEPTHCPTA